MTRGRRATAALGVVVALLGVVTLAVKGAYGSFQGGYRLTGDFASASYGLEPGTDVNYRGVRVGHVESVRLVDRKAQVRFRITSGLAVPADATAIIRPRSLFGFPALNLTFPDGGTGPFLHDGDRMAHTEVSAETGDLIATATPLLEKVDATDAATIISELAKTATGEGTTIADGIDHGAQLAAMFASTTQAQLDALDAFERFQAVLAPVGPDINALAADANIALPTLNAAQAAFDHLLTALQPFADQLASYLSQYRPDFEALLTQGDSVTRLLTLREPQLEQVVSGLYHYTFKFAAGASAETLTNGTKFAYFKNFVLFSDVNSLICSLIAPAQPGLGFLQPLQQAIAQAGTPLDCSAQAAAFARAQAAGTAPAGASSAAGAASQLSTDLAHQAAQPQAPQPLTVQALVNSVLGGQP